MLLCPASFTATLSLGWELGSIYLGYGRWESGENVDLRPVPVDVGLKYYFWPISWPLALGKAGFFPTSNRLVGPCG